MTSPSLTEFMGLKQLNISLKFLQKRNFLECQKTKVLIRNVLRDFFLFTLSIFSNQSSLFVTRLIVLH